MLVSGTLDDKVGRLFDVLDAAQAVGVINTLEKPQLDFLVRLYNAGGVHNSEDHEMVDIFIRRGILLDCGDNLEYSSPIMWRRFIQTRMGAFKRADDCPKTLEDLTLRIICCIDYKSIRETIGRSVRTLLPLERACEWNFIKGPYSVYR
jgi:hypothetical protein